MQFTMSARGKSAAQPIQQFIKQNFSHVPLEPSEYLIRLVENGGYESLAVSENFIIE